MKKDKQSSKKVSSLASKVLSKPSSSKTAKTLAASVLVQSPPKKKR